MMKKWPKSEHWKVICGSHAPKPASWQCVEVHCTSHSRFSRTQIASRLYHCPFHEIFCACNFGPFQGTSVAQSLADSGTPTTRSPPTTMLVKIQNFENQVQKNAVKLAKINKKLFN